MQVPPAFARKFRKGFCPEVCVVLNVCWVEWVGRRGEKLRNTDNHCPPLWAMVLVVLHLGHTVASGDWL